MQCVKEFNERDKEWCSDEDVSKETLLKVHHVFQCILNIFMCFKYVLLLFNLKSR